MFENASVDNAIFIGQKCFNTKCAIKVVDIKKSVTEINDPEFSEYNQMMIQPPKYFYEFNTNNGNNSDFIIKKINKHPLLCEFASAYFGIQTFDRKTYVATYKVNSEFVPVVDGVNVKHYCLLPHNEYVNFHPEAIKSGGNPIVYSKERILVRQIGEYPDGCLCPPHIYTMNTIYNIYLKNDKIDIKYLLGIINSKVMHYYWKVRFSDSKKTFPKIKKRPLESLPIAIPNIDIQANLISLVCEIIEAKTSENRDTYALESEIDLLVYHLYGLTYDEVLIVDPETPITREEYEKKNN